MTFTLMAASWAKMDADPSGILSILKATEMTKKREVSYISLAFIVTCHAYIPEDWEMCSYNSLYYKPEKKKKDFLIEKKNKNSAVCYN